MDPAQAPDNHKATNSKSDVTTTLVKEEEVVVDERTAESGTWLIVAKAVRLYLKNHETAMHCGSDALPALNAKITEALNDACGRAKLNGRRTIKRCDF